MERKRTQAERSAATRSALLAAARPRFAERGFAGVGTPEIAEAAGVTRGAMYHQFADKQALFRAVAEEVERDVTQRLADRVLASGATSPLVAMRVSVDAWLELCDEPEVRQVILLDAPNVLGWVGFRDLAQEYGLGLTERLLQSAVDAGELPGMPVTALAHVLLGALQEAAHVVTADPSMRDDVAAVLHRVLDGLGPRPQ